MHLTAEMFNQMAGIQLALVPYRGMAPVVTDLIGSHVAFGIIDPPSGMSAIEAGKIKSIAISSIKRFPRLPDILTVAESGVPGFESDRLVWHCGAYRHPGGCDCQTQCGVRDGPERSDVRRAHPRTRCRTDPDDASRIRRVRRGRDREVEQGRGVSERQTRLIGGRAGSTVPRQICCDLYIRTTTTHTLGAVYCSGFSGCRVIQ